jgi:hypothetical protein
MAGTGRAETIPKSLGVAEPPPFGLGVKFGNPRPADVGVVWPMGLAKITKTKKKTKNIYIYSS